MKHLVVVRKFRTKRLAELNVPAWKQELGLKAMIVHLGPGRFPWGLAVDFTAYEALFCKLDANKEAPRG